MLTYSNKYGWYSKKWHSLCFLAAWVSIPTLWLGCGDAVGVSTESDQDLQAKQMMEGVWMDEDEDEVVCMAKGDSLYFADETVMPMKFWFYGDSLYVQGNHLNRYHVTKQAEHLLRFVNAQNDEVKWVKGDEKGLKSALQMQRPYALNLNKVFSRDTLVHASGVDFDCHIFLQPTAERVIKSAFNDEGVEVDNPYLDNVAHVSIQTSGRMVYEHQFRKAEFSAYVPKDFMTGAILGDLTVNRADSNAVYLDATIGIPDAYTSYVVEVRVGKDGKVAKKLK